MRRSFALALLFAFATLGWSQQRPAITGIAFVRVYASDAAASADFYGKTLGFSSSKDGKVTRYPVNDLQWIEVTPLPSPAPASRLEAVGFMTRDARALESYLKAHSVEIVDPLRKGRFSVRDPEGNLIVFVQQVKGAAVPPAVPATAVSRRMIHAGLVVKDPAAENRFYREILGFRPYWHGGMNDTTTSWVSQQVPDGSDWLEYMLNVSPNATLKQIGVMDHMSLGVAHMNDAIAALERNHCEGPNCTAAKTGRDGKVQVNLYDPDLTRVEMMEFEPVEKPCCSEFTAKHPTEQEPR
ncbi:VOC family protein [Edaphobacter modestus]|uniref:Glyoxalase/bleomycin resistance protein/dioxygenase superfamily protein n=1 Tax=Edaphobacter modestus TaxID=388466 RepID=A0A4Q7YWC7_9BACT|nr:VOC family protein [Edaphobacter modestus]RZU42000.1 glyoxalase/bleomycin resistance protein/dioxygenase superfamily protein [Edaphobacter modestus]